MTPFQLRRALRTLRAGGVVAYPTEAVWGLGCDPLHAPAVARLLQLKRRAPEKGLILIAHDYAALKPFLAPMDKALEQRVLSTWPGPVTWLLPATRHVPDWLTGGRDSIAVRVTAHPVARGLCASFGRPLVSTSANSAARPAARTALRVRKYFGAELDGLVPGATGGLARPTEIRDARTARVIRR